jgi:acetyl esterase
MPVHPQAQNVLNLMATIGDPPIEQSTPTDVRAARAKRMRPASAPIHDTRDVDAGGVPARLYRPRDGDDLGLLVWLHGGGWVLGDVAGSEQLCRLLANASGHAVLSIDYRLAPEHPFPAALEDGLTAVRWANEHAAELGCRADRLAVGGDSAGGNIAAVIAQLAPVPLLFQLLVYPVVDCTRSMPSYEENATGYFLTRSGMGWFIDHYLSGGIGSAADPRVSPLLAADHVVAGTPPALVITAEFDPLRDEGQAYARRLAELGVPTSHVHFGGMLHGFVSLSDFLDDGVAAAALAGTAVGAALSR